MTGLPIPPAPHPRGLGVAAEILAGDPHSRDLQGSLLARGTYQLWLDGPDGSWCKIWEACSLS